MVLYSHINGIPVDADTFEPIYQMAEDRKVPVVLHPTVPTWGNAVKDYSMIPMIGIMVDTSIAVLRLILSGMLEKHPNLLVVHPHCGGVLPCLMPRIVEQTEIKRRGRENIDHSPEVYYKKVYQDLVSPSVQAMRYAYEFLGPEKLLFGSDHPWIKIQTFLDLVDRLDISDTDRKKILGENARNLFRI
jgi:predicted TIM-barrel fold metal-dependent hydrolase